MTQHGWLDSPVQVRDQIARLSDALQDALGEVLVGLYLHGSLVLGCFNLARSDIDLLAVTERSMSRSEKSVVSSILLGASGDWTPGPPRPLEISFLSRGDLDPWRHPTPYDLHFGEVWRPAFEQGLDEVLPGQTNPDADLAAHITVVRERGIVLLGAPIQEVFPPVPRADYVDSLLRDLRWSRDRAAQAPLYAILSMAREWATLATGELHSKDSGAAWATVRLPPDLRPLVNGAIASYRGDGADLIVDLDGLERFVAYVDARVQESVP